MFSFVRTRLSVMMFLFYFATCAWVVALATFLMSPPTRGGLYFTTAEVAWVYSTYALGGMIAPVFVGILSDRLFRTERVLGVCGLLCATLLFVAGKWCDHKFPEIHAAYLQAAAQQHVDGRPVLEVVAQIEAHGGPVNEAVREQIRHAMDRVKDDPAVRQVASVTFRPLFWLMLIQCLAAQIATTLTTVATLRNLPDATTDFSRCRLWGTVGWVLAGNVLGLFLNAVSSDTLYLAAISTAIFGLYSFTLPATHPRRHGKTLGEAFGLPALKLFHDRSFVVFMAVAFTVSTLNQFYVVYAHRYLTDLKLHRPEQVMTIAQVTEVVVMFLLPLFNPRRWMKALMMAGLAGYVVRGFALLTDWPPLVIMFGVPMHGWGYALFYVVAATYLDREAPIHLRASTQAVVAFVVSGIGPWTGNMFAAMVVDANRAGMGIEWNNVWQVPLIGNIVLLLAFAALFYPPADNKTAVTESQDQAKSPVKVGVPCEAVS